MTIDEAIQKHLGIANSYKDTVPDCDIAREHKQLTAWLRELKEANAIIRICRRVLAYLCVYEIDDTSTRNEVQTLLNCITEYLSGCSENGGVSDEAESLIRDIEDRTNDN